MNEIIILVFAFVFAAALAYLMSKISGEIKPEKTTVFNKNYLK